MNCKLSGRDADFIRVFHEFGFTKARLAREYHVHIDTVRNIIGGKSHRGHALRSGRRKLTDAQVRLVRQWASEGLGEASISRKLGGLVSRSTVRQVINRKSYQEVI